jgi:hypothetical protein
MDANIDNQLKEIIYPGIGTSIKINITEDEFYNCNEFGVKMYERPWHYQLAENRNTTPEKLRDSYINGVLFETGVKKFLENRFNIICPSVDLNIRTFEESRKLSYAADFKLEHDGYRIHVKSATYRQDKPSFLFEKNDKAYYAPDEYDWIVGGTAKTYGSAESTIIRIWAVYPLKKAKSLNLFKDPDFNFPSKQALHALDLI